MSNEAIEATCASVKDGNIAGVWEIEDFCECVSTCSSMWSRNWNKNADLSVEATVVLDFFAVVVHGMRLFNKG